MPNISNKVAISCVSLANMHKTLFGNCNVSIKQTLASLKVSFHVCMLESAVSTPTDTCVRHCPLVFKGLNHQRQNPPFPLLHQLWCSQSHSYCYYGS